MRILIIRPGAIGDTLLTFPIMQALRQHYPNPHITFVGNAHVLPLAQAFGLADVLSDYEHLQWSALFSTADTGRDGLQGLLHDTDLAICWLRDPDGIVAQNLRAAGIKRVIVAPGRPPEGERVHIVQYLARTLELEDIDADTVKLDCTIASLAGLDTRDTVVNNRLIAIHPGSGGAHKCWPVSKFAAVIQQLTRRDVPVLLLAGPADSERISALLALLTPVPGPTLLKVLNNAPLLEVAQRLQQCTCYLGNDSGITHLAALLGVPTIALFGPTDPAVWRPLGPRVRILQAHPLEQLSVDVAMEALWGLCPRSIRKMGGWQTKNCTSDI